jgi:hypothetical protein
MIEFGDNELKVICEYKYIGDDLLVIIFNENPHIGGVSLFCGEMHTIHKPHHKDHIISQKISKKLGEVLKKDVLVICGIHIDNATKDQIDLVIKNTEKCIQKLIKEIK